MKTYDGKVFGKTSTTVHIPQEECCASVTVALLESETGDAYTSDLDYSAIRDSLLDGKPVIAVYKYDDRASSDLVVWDWDTDEFMVEIDGTTFSLVADSNVFTPVGEEPI